MACALYTRNLSVNICEAFAFTTESARRVAIITCKSIMDTEGAAKTAKFVAALVGALQKYAPDTDGITAGLWVGLGNWKKELSFVGGALDVADVFKRWNTWLTDGAPRRWTGFIALVSVTAYRTLGLLHHAAKLRFFEMSSLVAYVGNIPVLGWLVKTIPFTAVSGIGLVFDSINNYQDLQVQQRQRMSEQINIYSRISKMWKMQAAVLTRMDQGGQPLANWYVNRIEAQYDADQAWLTALDAGRQGAVAVGALAGPAAVAAGNITFREQQAFNAIYNDLDKVTRFQIPGPAVGAPAGVAAPAVLETTISLLARKTAAEWRNTISAADGTGVANRAAARDVFAKEGRKWEVLSSNAEAIRAKPKWAIISNIVKLAAMILPAIGELGLVGTVGTIITSALACTPFMIGLGLVVTGTAIMKVMVGKRVQERPQLTPPVLTALRQNLAQLW